MAWLAHVAVFLVLAVSATGAAAAVVSVDATSDVARGWFRAIAVKADASVNRVLEYSEDGLPALRVVNVSPSGWVIVSAEDAVRPVLAFSLEGSFSGENLPPALLSWLQARRLEVTEARRNGSPRAPEVAEEWARLRADGAGRVPRASLKAIRRPLAVSNLLTTTWDQGPYYNASCPADAAGPGGHALTGCVATAMAQIMKKWNYPTTGTSSHSYVDPTYGTQSANFGATTYDWASMPGSVASPNAAVATLMYHCGVSVNMSYGASGSYAGVWSGAFVTYFGYSRSARWLSRSRAPSASEWNAVMKTELDAGRPIDYLGSGSCRGSLQGHSFVLAGYTTVGPSDYYEVNWGWSGSYDGSYSLDALNPGSDCWSENQGALTQIIPATQMPDPARLEPSPALPSSLNLGSSFQLNVSAGNSNSVLPTSGRIVFSFPDLTGASDGANVQFTSSTPSSANFAKYPAGTTITTADGFSMLAPYLMVEMVTPDWSGANNLAVSVTPKAGGPFRVDVRETLGYSNAWISDPATSSDTDQQGWPVARYTVSVVPPCTATVSGGGSICAGQIATIQAALGGVAPWSVTWSDKVTQSGLTASPVTRNVAPGTTTTYSVTAVSDAKGLGVESGSATVTVAGTAPSASITAPQGLLAPGSAGNTASVPDAGAGATYAWTLTNGTITAGTGTRAITWTAGSLGYVLLTATVTASGGCSMTGSATPRVGTAPTLPLTFAHLAGSPGGPGWYDGAGNAARFSSPGAVASDGAGNVFVADTYNQTIRKIVVASGVVSTFAGLAGSPGSADGTGSTARFYYPSGIAADGAGNVFVADTYGSTIRRIVVASGTVSTLAGLAWNPGSADGAGSTARFNRPFAVAADGAGNLFVADSGNGTIRRIVVATGAVTTVAGSPGNTGSADGTGSAARFDDPYGIAADGAGNVYVADTFNQTIRKIVVATGAVSTFAGLAGSPGSADGTGSTARFCYPYGIAADSAGNVFVADTYGSTIRKIVAATGAVTTLAGSPGNNGSVDGTSGGARFNDPYGIAADGAGHLFVADTDNDTIRKIVVATGAVTTLAGAPATPGSADGTGGAARFYNPYGIATDGAGSVYVADTYNNAIRKIVAATGAVTTLAGSPGTWGSADGTGNAARFNGPSGITADGAGNVYVADTYNNAIRKIVVATGAVTTLAGSPGNNGSADGTGGGARFNDPYGIAADGGGNVYVADTFNQTIRKIVVATGAVTTVAGSPGSSGSADGTGGGARFSVPWGLAADGAGNIFVADSYNQAIRKIVVATGDVTTLAGLAGNQGSADGTGGAARFTYPYGVATDGAGNVFVADTENQTIRKIVVATRAVTTVAGSPGNAGSADGTGSTARFNDPWGIAIDFSGNLFVVDSSSHGVRRTITPLADAATIDAPSGKVGQQRQLGTSPQTATSWSWQEVRIEPGSTATLSTTTNRNPTFTPDVVGTFVFLLTASDGTSTSVSTVSLQSLSSSATASATLSGTASICAGAPTTIQAVLAGVAPWSLTWSDGFPQNGVMASPATRSVSPATTTTYTVTAVSDANGSGATSGSTAVTVVPRPIAVASGSATIPLGQSTQLSGSGASNCSWTPGSGLDDPNSCAPRASPRSTTTYTLTVWNTGGCISSNAAEVTLTVLGPMLYTLAPCRVLDTRNPAGPLGAPPLQPGATRTFDPSASPCGIPADAVAISANLTVTNIGAPGELVVFPSDIPRPNTSAISFRAGHTRANNAIVSFSKSSATFSVFNNSAAPVDLVLDVNGFFR